MRTDKELDELYELSSPHPGWLSSLIEDGGITHYEEAYLEWRDRNDRVVKDSIRIWEDKMERNGGLAYHDGETPQEKLAGLTAHLDKIDAWCEGRPYPIAEAYRDEMNYKKLLRTRATLRLSLDQPVSMSETDIAKAREVRLDSLLKDKLKRGFMKCPTHPEKHASFYVTSYGYCFGCLRSWNAIDWMVDIEKMRFVDAIKHLLAL